MFKFNRDRPRGPALLSFVFFKFNRDVLQQIKSAQGVLSTATNATGLMNFYTLTSWESKEDMLVFMRSGAHAVAMKNSSKFASKITTDGYESESLPSWKEIITKLNKK